MPKGASEATPYLFYCTEVLAPEQEADTYRVSFWRPSGIHLAPAGVTFPRFALYTLMYRLGMFANRDYALALIADGGRVVHRSCVQPRDFRYPFMADGDLQIGDVETAPSHRGKKLAERAVRAIVKEFGRPGRRFWYVTRPDNEPSVRMIERAGFRLAGTGKRRARWGGLCPYYTLDTPAK